MSDTLMVSVSGMRGIVGKDLTPELVARHAAALGAWARAHGKPSVVLGRDARTSGPMYSRAAAAGLMSVGAEVIDVGLVPTPTVQLAVEHHHAGGGLILTASHNPIEWNALKFVGPDGIFLDGAAGAEVRALAERGPERTGWEGVGRYREDRRGAHPPPRPGPRPADAGSRGDPGAPASRWLSTACAGPAAPRYPPLLTRLGCRVNAINLETDGRFPRPPEPIPENLGDLGRLVRATERRYRASRSIPTLTGWPWWTNRVSRSARITRWPSR